MKVTRQSGKTSFKKYSIVLTVECERDEETIRRIATVVHSGGYEEGEPEFELAVALADQIGN